MTAAAAPAKGPSPSPSRSGKRFPKSSEPHRYTLKVPLADANTEQWWAAQDDPSASVRSLIREEIMKHGFTDTVNRPVVQMPRRGRPPMYADFDEPDEPEAEQRAQAVQPAPSEQTQDAVPVNRQVEDASGLASLLEDGEIPAPASPQTRREGAHPIEPAQPVEFTPVTDIADTDDNSQASAAFDMDDIFGHSG